MTPLGRRDHGRGSERGTALLLAPAAFVVVLVLAAIAVDLSAQHLARRRLEHALATAADDAAGMVDRAELAHSGRVVLDAEAARRVVVMELAAAVGREGRGGGLGGPLVGEPRIAVDPIAGTVDVSATITVRPIFGGVVGAPTERITASVRGCLETG